MGIVMAMDVFKVIRAGLPPRIFSLTAASSILTDNKVLTNPHN